MNEVASDAAVEFGKRVRSRRTEIGISQEIAADRAGIHVSNYGKIERGFANPSLHTILRIATAIEIDPGQLVLNMDADWLPN